MKKKLKVVYMWPHMIDVASVTWPFISTEQKEVNVVTKRCDSKNIGNS